MLPEVAAVFRRLGPIILIMMLMPAPLILASRFISYVDGGVAYLYYAERLVLLAPSLLGFAISSVLFPDFADLVAAKNWAALSKLFRRVVVASLGLGLTALAGFLLLGEWGQNLLFGRGALTEADLSQIRLCMQLMSPLIVLSFLQQPAMRLMFARNALWVGFSAGLTGVVCTYAGYWIASPLGILEAASISAVTGIAGATGLVTSWALFWQPR